MVLWVLYFGWIDTKLVNEYDLKGVDACLYGYIHTYLQRYHFLLWVS